MPRRWIDPEKAQRFQLVHKSFQEGDELVLREIPLSLNVERRRMREEPPMEIALSTEGEAQEIEEFKEFPGKYSPDGYDYSQHLKTMGTGTFVPSVQVLPPITEIDEFDPEIADVFYALEDEDYIEQMEDDFVDALNCDELPEGYEEDDMINSDDEDWLKEFKKFKVKDRRNPKYSDAGSGSGSGSGSDAESYSGSNVTPRNAPSNTYRTSRTATTSYSMSSSSIFRNEKLALLDDQFEKVLEEYDEEEWGELAEDDPDVLGHLTLEQDEIFDEFLNSTRVNAAATRVVDRRSEHWNEVRDILKDDKDRIVSQYSMVDESVPEALPLPEEPARERWDVETVVSGYTNIYNRPQLIREASKNAPKISLKGRLGMPRAEPEVSKPKSSHGTATKPVPKDETPEERKLRKAQVKNEKKVV